MKTTLLVCFLLSTYASAAEIPGCPNCLTADFRNGRAWAQLDQAAKIYYLTGVMESSIAASADLFFNAQGIDGCDNPKSLAALTCPTCATLDIIAELDAFYQAPANRGIPVVFALPVCVKKFKGATAADIQQHVERLRKLFNDVK
jgi:hypothetical protein